MYINTACTKEVWREAQALGILWILYKAGFMHADGISTILYSLKQHSSWSIRASNASGYCTEYNKYDYTRSIRIFCFATCTSMSELCWHLSWHPLHHCLIVQKKNGKCHYSLKTKGCSMRKFIVTVTKFTLRKLTTSGIPNSTNLTQSSIKT